MATKGSVIINKLTGEEITWIETSIDNGGKSLIMDFTVAPDGKVPVRHIHPNQDELFEIKSGVLKVEHKGEIKYLSPGDMAKIPMGDPHQWWNESKTEPIKMRVTLQPALNTVIFFEQYFGLANDNKSKADGSPKFLQIMAMCNKYEMFIDGPPIFIQRLMGFLLGGFAKLIGYKSYYRKYSES